MRQWFAKASRWIFPIGAFFTIFGPFFMFLAATFYAASNRSLIFNILGTAGFLSPLIGFLFAIIGVFIERKRLTVSRSRRTGLISLVIAAIFFLLFATTGNIHSWTFAFSLSMMTALIVGLILVSKMPPPVPPPPGR